MKLTLKICFLLLLFTPVSYANTITFAADNWCPYNCNADSGEKGFIVDALVEIYSAEGFEVKYINTPWTRAVEDLKNGRVDAIIGTSPREVPEAFFPKEEAGFYAPMYFVRKGYKWKYKDYSSFNGLILCAVADYHYGGIQKNVESHKEDRRVIFVRGNDVTDRLLRLLVKSSIDVFLEDPSVVLYSAKKLGYLNEIDSVLNPDKSSDSKVFIGFTKHNPKSKLYADIFTKGMKKLRKSGKFAKILAKYGLKDWRK